MEDMKQIKNVAVLPNISGPGSWEIFHWLSEKYNYGNTL